MVSFWPFGHDDSSSPKSFERSLSLLSTKITRLQARNDSLRASHRRAKVLFTLYSSFVYILVFLILTLVTGYEKWQTLEWTAVAGSPVAIYAIRYLLDVIYDWREDGVRSRLDDAVRERDKVIKKLKDAMRYDSTQELLDKYGGAEAGRGAMKTPQKRRSSARPGQQQQQQQQQRTGFAPPPTANIPGRTPPPQNLIDARLRPAQGAQQQQPGPAPLHSAPHSRATSESFAPNAFDQPPSPQSPSPYQPSHLSQPDGAGGSHRHSFVDRMLDLVLGDDEAAPKNRIVLLCASCRLVNGQAPPGTRSLEELGRWRCAGCGAWNGVENEVGKVLSAARARADRGGEEDAPAAGLSASAEVSEGSLDHGEDSHAAGGEAEETGGGDESEDEAMGEDGEDTHTPPAGSTRSKARQRQKP